MEKAYSLSDLGSKIAANSVAVAVQDLPVIMGAFLAWLPTANKNFASLKEAMKKVLPQMMEDEIIAVTKAVVAWFKESAALSENKVDDLFSGLISVLESEIYALEGKIVP